MPNMQTCSVCGQVFDFDEEGVCDDISGKFVCGEVCVIKKTISRGHIACMIITTPKLEETPTVPKFNICNYN